jgi:predicted oxidoreductase
VKQIELAERKLSAIAYGCMQIGGSWDEQPISPEEEAHAFSAIDSALSQGITVFDHADIYCRGKSEEVFGRYLTKHSGLREKIFIQSKCGIQLGTSDKPQYYDFSPEYIESSVHRSLERLGMSYLDLFFLHRPDPLVDWKLLAPVLVRLQDQGLVRNWAVSNFTQNQIEAMQSQTGILPLVNQIQLSLEHHFPVSNGIVFNSSSDHQGGDIYSYCRSKGILIQSWGSLAGGRLSSQPGTAELLHELSQKYQVPGEALLAAWLLRIPGGIQPVIGTTNPDRIAAAARASEIELDRIDWYRLLRSVRHQEVP